MPLGWGARQRPNYDLDAEEGMRKRAASKLTLSLQKTGLQPWVEDNLSPKNGFQLQGMPKRLTKN